MSIKAINWAFEKSSAPDIHRVVLLAIADRADERGMAWPSIEDISRRSGRSPQAVSRSIRWLKDHGQFVEVKTFIGRGYSNTYRLHLLKEPSLMNLVKC